MKPKDAFGLIGLLMMIAALLLAFNGISPWYTYFVLGGTFFLGIINYRLGNNSVFREFERDRQNVFIQYCLFVICACFIELFGRGLLGWWTYSISGLERVLHVFVLTYPLAFFMIYETLTLIRSYIDDFATAALATQFVSAFVHEFPNTYAQEWVYLVPFGFTLLGINVVVIVGWIILVSVPLVVHKTVHWT